MISLFSFITPFFAEKAYADVGPPPPGGSITLPNPLSCADLFCLLEKVILVIFNIAIPVTVIMVLIGAFQILTAGGDPAKFATGQKTILYAAVGFALVILANSLVAIIRSFF